tara:strand:+ start:1828 stop:6438 length:4611 start_codon:yes stop_codon:yes gene_type:complete
MRSSRIFLPILLILNLLFSCAKELPKVESESIKSNVFSIEEIKNASVDLEFSTEKRQSIKSKVGEIYALNTFSLKRVSSINTNNTKLVPLFEEIKLLLPEETSKINVRFKVTSNHIVAYYNVTTPKTLKSLSMEGSDVDNIFQYQIQGFGIKRRSKNANNEETRNIEFHSTSKEEATHIKISALSTSRQMGDLHALDEKQKRELFLKEKLNGKELTRKQIRTILNDRTILNNSKITDQIFEDSSVFVVRIFKDEAYLFSKITKSDLLRKEKQALKNDIKIKSILKCNNSDMEDCFLRAEYKFDTNPVIKEYTQDERGKTLAPIEFKSKDDLNIADILKININSLVDTRSELFNAFPNLENKPLVKKNKIDLNSEYVFLPSTHDTPRKVADASAFFQGQERIVKLKLEEDGLIVYEQESDTRFQDNELNNSPVLKISGSHLDYDCLEKEENTCVGDIEASNNDNWKKRRFFAPNLDSLKHFQVNNIDLFNLGSSCFREIDSEMTHYEFKKGVINIEQEKTFKVSTNFACIARYFFSDNMESTSFKVKFFYSLVRLKDLASSDYVAVDYPTKDQDKFGFFKNERTELAQDYTSSRSPKKYFLNRFNPKKNEITYALSEEFGREENKYILDATKEVIANINKSLNSAEANIQITLEDPKKIYPGDLRKNSIVLITDPLANGLLGYGPSVSNPRTGEILQAHTNMYLGVLRQTTRSTYKLMESMSKENPITFESKQLNFGKLELKTTAPVISNIHIDGSLSNKLKVAQSIINQKSVNSKDSNLNIIPSHTLKEHSSHHDHSHAELNHIEKSIDQFDERLNRLAKNNAFHKEFLNYSALGKKIIKEIREDNRFFTSKGHLISWEKLPEDLKELAIKRIITQAYKTTLAHEIGHNLGLRHNFQGSHDKANFYTQSEINSDVAPQYSSIMDYGLSQLNELPIMGKYDIAALRFGYARKFEKTTGELVSIPTTLEQATSTIPQNMVKAYEFCTDENAGSNLTCNRFDEGTNLTEIIQSSIRQYEQSYKFANKRDGRKNFTTRGIDNYIRYRAYHFTKFRMALRTWMIFNNLFRAQSPELMYEGCPKAQEITVPFCKTINDTINATKLAAQQLLNILATPDKTCAVAVSTDPTKIVTTMPLRDIYSKVKYGSKDPVIDSCFHEDIVKELSTSSLVPIAEGGKFINDVKGTHPEYRYNSDIMIRGIWSDKLLAIKYLFQRSGSMTEPSLGTFSFYDHKQIRRELMNYINHITLGSPLRNQIPFTDKDSNPVKVQYGVSGIDYIPEQPTWLPTIIFGLPGFSGELFNRLNLNLIVKSNYSTDPITEFTMNELDNTLGVNKFNLYDSNIVESLPKDKTKSYYNDQSETYFVSRPSNLIAEKMISVINEYKFLKGIDKQVVERVFTHRAVPTPDPAWCDEQKNVFKFILKMGVDFAEKIKSIVAAGKTFTKEELLAMNLPEEVVNGILKMQNLSVNQIEQIIHGINNPRDVSAPADAPDKIKKLYTLNMFSLELYMYGIMEQKVEEYKVKLEWLPEQGKTKDFIRAISY